MGAGTLIRATRRWWRLLAIPAAFAVLEFAIIPLSVAAHVANAPATNVRSATPASHGVACRQVAFRTADNVLLSGWYIPARNGAAVVLLRCPGRRSLHPRRRGGRCYRAVGSGHRLAPGHASRLDRPDHDLGDHRRGERAYRYPAAAGSLEACMAEVSHSPAASERQPCPARSLRRTASSPASKM